MNDKTQARLRRARKSRVRMRTAGDVRLTVNRTPRHIYAQINNIELAKIAGMTPAMLTFNGRCDAGAWYI